MSIKSHDIPQRKSLQQVLIENKGLTKTEANQRINQARDELLSRIECGELPWDFCQEEFGLEPDYLDDLLL